MNRFSRRFTTSRCLGYALQVSNGTMHILGTQLRKETPSFRKKHDQHQLTIVAPQQLGLLNKELYNTHNIAFESVIQASTITDRFNETKQIWQVCQQLKPTFLVYTTFVLEGWSIAEKLDIPSVVISLFPLDLYPIPSTFEKQIQNEFADWYAGALKEIWHPHIQHWMWRLFLEDQGDFRDDVLGLDPIPRDITRRIPPFIYAIDPDLLCLADTYHAHVCGYWTAIEQSVVSPSAIKNPVLLINFGSMDTLSNTLLEPREFLLQINTRLNEILHAFDQLDIIWIVSNEHTALFKHAPTQSKRIQIMTAIEHADLIKKHPVIGMIHHGGIGTCSTMIQLGVAQAILPFMFDQYYWADRLDSLGLSKTLDINTSWVDVVSWMLYGKDLSTIDYWKKRTIDNTIKGLDDAVQIMLSYQSQI
jgi:UDP:flavonoid glycosyltransferase YjiC (YdhE family)